MLFRMAIEKCEEGYIVSAQADYGASTVMSGFSTLGEALDFIKRKMEPEKPREDNFVAGPHHQAVKP